MSEFQDAMTSQKHIPVIHGLIGTELSGAPTYLDLNEQAPHAIIYGQTGIGKTNLLNVFLSSLTLTRKPSQIQITLINGGGDAFATLYQNNPLLESEPLGYLTGKNVDKINHTVDKINRDRKHELPAKVNAEQMSNQEELDRIREKLAELNQAINIRLAFLSQHNVTTLNEYNREYAKDPLAEKLIVIEDVTNLIQTDRTLRVSDVDEKSIQRALERILKLGRSVGIHLLLTSQTARKEFMSGSLTANITNRISLKVNSPIESDIITGSAKGVDLSSLDILGSVWFNDTITRAPYISSQEVKDISQRKTFSKEEYSTNSHKTNHEIL